MHFFSSKKIYIKIVSFFVSFLFLIESMLLPIMFAIPLQTYAATGTVIIKTTKDGAPWDSPHFVINNTGPLGTFNGDFDTNASGQQTFADISAGTYTMNYAVSLPAGVTLQDINSASLPYSQVLQTGGTVTFTFNFVTAALSTGTVIIKTTKDGVSWNSPHFVINNTGPLGTFNGDFDTNASGEQIFGDLPPGEYTMNSVVLLPVGVALQNVNDSSLPYSQTVAPGEMITFVLNFVAVSPTAPVLDSMAPTTITDGDTNISFIFTGANFQTGAQLRIFHPASTLLGETTSTTTPAVSVISSSELQWGPFPVMAADPGNYDFQVKNPDGQVSGLKRVVAIGTPPSSGSLPTPTTAPMATLTLEREQERILPDQLISFSGTLDNGILNAAELAFPQGSSFFVAIPEKTVLERIEIDGRALGNGEFSLSDGSAKIPFAQNWYAGSHPFRIVLRNAVSSVPQLDRQVSVWVSVVDAANKLLLKGRTASTMMAHLPTEVIGKGVSLTVPRTITGWMPNGTSCCWGSVGLPLLESGGSAVPGSTIYNNKTYFPIREFGFSEIDITRGPFFTPNQIPLLPENIALTLFPSDASMQRIGLSLQQFSDPLAKEFITAQYQYLLGRDPSSEELLRYLPKFTAWRNPYANLMEVYNRRSDIQQAVMVPRGQQIGGSNDGSPRPSWDKLLEWVSAYGWKEEPSLASFKPQSGFDNGWQPFKELWEKYMCILSNCDKETGGNIDPIVYPLDYARDNAEMNPVAAIAYLCYTSNMNHKNSQQDRKVIIDFEFCWKNDPLVRHTAILWAKDVGWAYNHIFKQEYADAEHGGYLMGVSDTIINPSGPILAQMFGPGKYTEFAVEQQLRYPPAQLYYDLISSPEYASSIQQRFRANIDSIFRLFFSRPATESDIAWVKNKFLGGIASYEFSDSKVFGFDRRWSWINEQWEPNGGLIASNFTYVEDEEFLKNSRFITDDVYGIRHIPGEIDAVSSRLVEMIERRKRQELYQGDNFKRIITGLYRLYLRRNPTDAEIESRRASGKDFGDIEFSLNQSSEYGDGSAPAAAIRNLYRNYLGRDPSDADIASWTGKSISAVANALGKSAEVRAYAQQHPENAYIFPIKEIKIKKCGFFCSIMGKIIGIALTVISIATGNPFIAFISGGFTGAGVVSCGTCMGGAVRVSSIVLNSLSRSFNNAGFNGETFVSWVSVARAMAGQAGGVFSMANLFENADPTILDGFRTMARAPQNNAFVAGEMQERHYGLASVLSAASNYLGAKPSEQPSPSSARLAQIDISGHYGEGSAGGFIAPAQRNSQTTQSPAANKSITKKLTRGSRGDEVLLLQKILGETDLTFSSQYQIGYYGAKTEAAVKRFQKRNGLPQVGTVGPKTRALLNSR